MGSFCRVSVGSNKKLLHPKAWAKFFELCRSGKVTHGPSFPGSNVIHIKYHGYDDFTIWLNGAYNKP